MPEGIMEAKAGLFGHPIHQMLIPFPLGLLATAAIFDVLRLARNNGHWSEMAFWMIAAGIVGGLIAALFGLIDWLGIPAGTRAKRIGALHGIGNVVVVALSAGSWLLRRPDPTTPTTTALVLSFAGVALVALTGWLGGELVDQLGVGVNDGANVNAPNSLSIRR
jgi:uncharacterized membrane protein